MCIFAEVRLVGSAPALSNSVCLSRFAAVPLLLRLLADKRVIGRVAEIFGESRPPPLAPLDRRQIRMRARTLQEHARLWRWRCQLARLQAPRMRRSIASASVPDQLR